MQHEFSPAAGRDLGNRSIKDLAPDGKYVQEMVAMDARSQSTTSGQTGRQAFW